MNHLLILPILVPLCCACILLVVRRESVPAARGLALLSSLVQLVIAAILLEQTRSGAIQLYTLGNWLPPHGIVLVLDKFAALLVFTTAILALPALIFSTTGADRHGKYFHALFQFQLMGINGAFLTGDLFNLFVFFEVLLIASYGLLLNGKELHGKQLHGKNSDHRDAARTRAGVHYVVLNLIGSALFLIAAGVFYGLSGTLNFADLSVYIAVADATDAPFIAAAGLLLLVVFGLKAALFPLYFWLPRGYAAASAPVAALFAIMTKVGIYAIVRLATLLFGAHAGLLSGLLLPWLTPLALITLALGAFGALAATTLSELIAYLVVASVGTLLSALALDSIAALTALLYYLLHSTWIIGALFLLADLIATQRGTLATQLRSGPAIRHGNLLGALFVIAALSLAGLPPLAGFIGKMMLLQAAPLPTASSLWIVVLSGGLLALIALSRAGSVLFWRVDAVPSVHLHSSHIALSRNALGAVFLLLTANVALSIYAGPISAALRDTAVQLLDAKQYSGAVLSLVQNPAETTQ